MTAKVSITNVEPNTSDFGISGSQVIVNQVSGELYTRTLNNQVKRIGADSAFTPSGTPSVSTDVQTKLRQIKSVFDYMTAAQIADVIARTYSVDVTAALQAAITDALTLTGGALYWPNGGYKITSALTIGQISGVLMVGQSRNGVVIRQDTNNTQIFKLTTCDSSEFEICNFSFSWLNNQAAANTSAIGIYFDGTSGTPANGFYNFHIHHCHFTNGYRSISANSGIQLAVWGFEISECMSAALMTGAFYFYSPSPSIGTPNCCIRNLYLRADVASEPLINVLGWGASQVVNVEVNNGTIGGAGNPNTHLLFTSCTNLVVESCREENVIIASTGLAVWTFAQCNAELRGVEIASLTVNAGLTGLAITSSTPPNKVSVNGMSMSLTLLGGAAGYMFNGGFGIVENYKWVGTAGTAFYNTSATYTFDDLTFQIQNTTNVGDASVVLTAASQRVQYFNSTLTANRTCTLPTPTFIGQEFLTVRSATTPGAFTLTVVDPTSGLSYIIPKNCRGWVRYAAVTLSAWVKADRQAIFIGSSADNGDAAKAITVGTDEPTQLWNTALTGNRAVTLNTSGVMIERGSKWHIVRQAGATGASTLDVGTGPLKSLAVSQWCIVEYDGSAWFLSAFGSL